LAYAYHLYFCYRDYEQAEKHLQIAKTVLPNDPEALELQAFMDRRQGRYKEAVQGLKNALELDPQNPQPNSDLAVTLWALRQFRDAEEVYDRLIKLLPDQPSLEIEKAWFITLMETGDDSKLKAIIGDPQTSALPDRVVVSTIE
jgi:tetratricopeptide (TPR) repeat protein